MVFYDQKETNQELKMSIIIIIIMVIIIKAIMDVFNSLSIRSDTFKPVLIDCTFKCDVKYMR